MTIRVKSSNYVLGFVANAKWGLNQSYIIAGRGRREGEGGREEKGKEKRILSLIYPRKTEKKKKSKERILSFIQQRKRQERGKRKGWRERDAEKEKVREKRKGKIDGGGKKGNSVSLNWPLK